MMVEIQDRREVQIEAEKPQLVACEHSRPGDLVHVSLAGKIGCRWQRGCDLLGPSDPSTFLIDGEDRLVYAQSAEGIREVAGLLR